MYLGVVMLRTRGAALSVPRAAPRSTARLFTDGALSNVLNPKIAIFYFAFLPQFVPAGSASPGATVLALGTAFAALTFLVKGPVALGAGALSGWLRSRPAAPTWVYRTSGAVLVGLGLRLAFERRAS